MIDEQKSIPIDLGTRFYPDVAPINAVIDQLPQPESEVGKLGALFNWALQRLEELILSWVEQLPDNPNPEYPYFWGGPLSYPYSSRFKRYL